MLLRGILDPEKTRCKRSAANICLGACLPVSITLELRCGLIYSFVLNLGLDRT